MRVFVESQRRDAYYGNDPSKYGLATYGMLKWFDSPRAIRSFSLLSSALSPLVVVYYLTVYCVFIPVCQPHLVWRPTSDLTIFISD